MAHSNINATIIHFTNLLCIFLLFFLTNKVRESRIRHFDCLKCTHRVSECVCIWLEYVSAYKKETQTTMEPSQCDSKMCADFYWFEFFCHYQSCSWLIRVRLTWYTSFWTGILEMNFLWFQFTNDYSASYGVKIWI